MKILHVNKFFDLHGGADIYLQQLIREQEKAGHEVHALSTRSDRNLPSKDSAHFVERFSFDKREGALKDLQKASAYIWNREAKREMNLMIQDIKPDVIHLHNLYHHLSTSVLAPIRYYNIPCVQTLHDYKLACPNYKMFTENAPCERCKGGKYLNAIKHQCLSQSFLLNSLAVFEMGMTKSRQSYEKTVNLFLCPSHFMQEKMEDWGEPSGKMRYVPNPTYLPEVAAPRGGGYILYAGRLSPEKGLRNFLEAAVQIPELPVKIVGKGPEEESLKKFILERGAKNIELLGFRAPADLATIRAHAEAVVLPTLSYENASGALLEAMADGLPCLATCIGGNPELVDDELTGFLVTPNDAEDWLRILRRFLALPREARDFMGQEARRKIEQGRTWSQHVERVEACYKEAGAKI